MTRDPNEGTGEVRAHAPGVGALVVVVDALEVLGRRQRRDAMAITQHEQRTLGAHQSFFDHDASPGVAEALPRQLRGDVGLGLFERVGDEYALAGGEAVGLHHPRPGQVAQEGLGRFGVVEGPVAGRGHAGLGQDRLHERLRSFEAGSVGAGAEHETAVGAQLVGQAVHQRLLGADHEQVGVDVFRRIGGDGDGKARAGEGEVGRVRSVGRMGRHAGIAGGHHHVGGAGQRQRQGVLTPARADDADFHAANRTNCSRPGPTPTSLMGTPIWSAKKAT